MLVSNLQVLGDFLLNEPWSKVAILGMAIPPLIGNPCNNGYINPYYWVDDHPLLNGNNGSLDPSTNGSAGLAILWLKQYDFGWHSVRSANLQCLASSTWLDISP